MKSGTLCLLLLGACSWMPGGDDPRVTARVYYAAYELTGDASMQSRAGNTISDNPAIGIGDFEGDSRGDDFGGELSLGDGFSSWDLAYLKIDLDQTEIGRLPANFGRLVAGDSVRTQYRLDEFRLRYIAGLVDVEPREDWRLRAGLGGALVHRDATFESIELNSARKQRIKIQDDGVVYLAGRARADWRSAFLQVDYAVSPDLTFGGDYEGTLQDLEIRLGWRFADQEIEAAVGWRLSEIPAEGSADGLRYDADFGFEGFFVVLGLTF